MSALSEHVEEYLRARRALGRQARASRPTAAETGRLPGGRRREHDHTRAGDLLGQTARRRTSTALGGAAVDRARVRRLPADDRPGDRDPAGRACSRPATSARPRTCGPKQDIRRLLDAARGLRPPLKAASYEALFGLLAVTGMRLGEAIALEPGDVDLDDGVITIRRADRQARARPSGPAAPDDRPGAASTTPEPERCCAQAPRSSTFFLSSVGTSLDRSAVAKTLRTLTTALGLRTDTVHPTAHQLRHSFAVSTLIDWQRSGAQVDEQIAVLSTYLGHVSPAETYWYLTATPELMDSAAQRLERHLGGRP